MNTIGDIEQIQQGEEWNFDKIISASDREYIPYIISSSLNHPFFVITVASTKFEKNLRYVKSWWSDVTEGDGKQMRFFKTNPIYVGEQPFVDILDEEEGLADLPVEPGVGLFSEFTVGDNTNYAIGERDIPMNALYQYTKADEEIDPELGHKPYHYFYFNYTELENNEWVVDDTLPRIDDYECRVIFNFPTEITQDWAGQNYLYQVTLVDGLLMPEMLEAIHTEHPTVEDWPDTIIEQYRYVKANWPKALQGDIDEPPTNETIMLGRIDLAIPILRPSKLEVFNNTRNII